jgi:hypothetical protein
MKGAPSCIANHAAKKMHATLTAAPCTKHESVAGLVTWHDTDAQTMSTMATRKPPMVHDERVPMGWSHNGPVCFGFWPPKLLRTAKRSAFQSASIKFVGAKTIQNQHKHIIG